MFLKTLAISPDELTFLLCAPLSELSLEQIGGGAQANTFLVKRPKDLYLVLRIADQYSPLSVDPQCFRTTGQAFMAVRSPNVVRVYGVTDDRMVMEHVPYSIYDMLGTISPQKMIRDIVCGMRSLFRAGCVHGDISADNVRVDRTGNAKLLDPGLSEPIGHLSPTARRLYFRRDVQALRQLAKEFFRKLPK